MQEIPVHFILGFARSGSTLLMGLCRTHPDIETDVNEPNGLYRLVDKVYINYKNYEHELGLKPAQVERMYFKAVRDFTQSYYQQLCEVTGRKVLVVKHPWMTPRIEVIKRMFPGSQILVLLRHPYDAVASAVHMTEINIQAEQMYHGRRNLRFILDTYKQHMSAVMKVRNMIDAERYMELKFEGFLEDSETSLKAMFSHFGVNHDIELVREIIIKANKNKANLVGACLSSSYIVKPENKWKLRLRNQERDMIRAELPLFVKAFGYKEK